jgi:hypothetical protein
MVELLIGAVSYASFFHSVLGCTPPHKSGILNYPCTMRHAKTLFDPIVAHKKLNARFEHLRTEPSSEAARLMLDDVFQDFVDADGNFREQFQTTLRAFAGLPQSPQMEYRHRACSL